MVPSPAKPSGWSPSAGGFHGPEPLAKPSLSASTASHGQVANLVQEHRALQRIHLCDVRSQLRQKRIAEYRRRLFMAAAARITKQVANVDFQRGSETRQRR